LLTFPSFYRPVRLAALCAAVFACPVMAGPTPAPTHLPRCHSAIAADVTCRLPVKDDTFDHLRTWAALGQVSLAEEPANSYAVLGAGSALQQPVYAHFYKWNGATYALRFRVRADAEDAVVHAALSMSDDSGRKVLPIGSTTVVAVKGEWTVVELMAASKPFGAPAHVLVEITNVNDPGKNLHVDDVFLVESADVEVVAGR